MHHVILVHFGKGFMVSSSAGKKNAQEGRKTHSMQLHNCDITAIHFLTETHMLSTGHGTAAAARNWLDIVTGR